jgi:hypothetical protein
MFAILKPITSFVGVFTGLFSLLTYKSLFSGSLKTALFSFFLLPTNLLYWVKTRASYTTNS